MHAYNYTVEWQQLIDHVRDRCSGADESTDMYDVYEQWETSLAHQDTLRHIHFRHADELLGGILNAAMARWDMQGVMSICKRALTLLKADEQINPSGRTFAQGNRVAWLIFYLKGEHHKAKTHHQLDEARRKLRARQGGVRSPSMARCAPAFFQPPAAPLEPTTLAHISLPQVLGPQAAIEEVEDDEQRGDDTVIAESESNEVPAGAIRRHDIGDARSPLAQPAGRQMNGNQVKDEASDEASISDTDESSSQVSTMNEPCTLALEINYELLALSEEHARRRALHAAHVELVGAQIRFMMKKMRSADGAMREQV